MIEHITSYLKIFLWLLAILVLVFMYVPSFSWGKWLKGSVISIAIIGSLVSFNPLVKLVTPPSPVVYETSLFPTIELLSAANFTTYTFSGNYTIIYTDKAGVTRTINDASLIVIEAKE